jgi:hypothetical protein
VKVGRTHVDGETAFWEPRRLLKSHAERLAAMRSPPIGLGRVITT